MSRGSRAVASLTLGLAGLGGAGTAFAHDPIIFTDTQTSPDAGPLLPDGTISFALYGTLISAGDTRGLRARFDAGDSLDITLLIPDRPPENELPDSLLPTLRIDAPDGTSRTLAPTERVRFDESFSGTSYVRYIELGEPAQTGEYRLSVIGAAPARFTLAVGTTERFGTPVENVPNRADGGAGVQRWYATPPPDTATPTPTAGPSTPGPSTTVSSTAAIGAEAADSGPPQTAPAIPRSTQTEGSGLLAMAMGVLVVLVAGSAAGLVWLRRRPPGPQGADDVRTP